MSSRSQGKGDALWTFSPAFVLLDSQAYHCIEMLKVSSQLGSHDSAAVLKRDNSMVWILVHGQGLGASMLAWSAPTPCQQLNLPGAD